MQRRPTLVRVTTLAPLLATAALLSTTGVAHAATVETSSRPSVTSTAATEAAPLPLGAPVGVSGDPVRGVVDGVVSALCISCWE